MEGNLHSSCIPTNLFPTPIARKDDKLYHLPPTNARGKKEINTTARMMKLQTLSIYPFFARAEKTNFRISPSLMPPTGDAPLHSGTGRKKRRKRIREKRRACLGRLSPSEGANQAASGVLGSHASKGSSGAGVSLDSSSSCRLRQSSYEIWPCK